MTLGVIACPICGADCELKLTKKNKAYVNCGECGSQTFARGAVSDSKLRERIRKIEAAAEQAAPEPVKKPVPAVTVTQHSSEGQTVRKDKTIFDYMVDFAEGKK